MAIRRYYPSHTRPTTTTFPERVQVDKFPPVYPNTTSSLKSRPQYYPYYSKPLGFSAATFAEGVSRDRFQPLYPDRTTRLMAKPHYTPYFWFGKQRIFSPSDSIVDAKPRQGNPGPVKKATPQYYPYTFPGLVPRVPNVAGFDGNTLDIHFFKNSRMIIINGQAGVSVIVAGKARNLPLLGVG